MSLLKDRWKVISPSMFPWEQEALDYLREEMSLPWALRGWSNFEIVDAQGRRYEIDALLLTVRGCFLVEIKSYPGLVYVDEYRFVRQASKTAPTVVEDNPLSGANLKCKILKNILCRQPAAQGKFVPHITPLVFLSHEDVQVAYKQGVALDVYTRADLMRRLGLGGNQPPLIDVAQESVVLKALADSGVSGQKRRSLKVGDWVLQSLLGEGPDYQDHLARHASLETMKRRVRTYVARTDNKIERERAARSARREFSLLDGINHDGILRPLDFQEHELGLALLYEFFPDAMRLDQYLAPQAPGEKLDLKTRLLLWRQLADILRYAHERRILHRSLAPQNILVTGMDKSLPQLKVINWQTGRSEDRTTGTIHIEELVEDRATAYIAPEALADPTQADQAADVFSLGCVGYFLLSGRAPAESQMELMQKLLGTEGLRLSEVMDGVHHDLEELIESCTQPDVNLRVATVGELLEMLDLVEHYLTAPPEPTTKVVDPFTASPGESLAPGLKLVKRLGQGSVAVAFLVERDDGERLVLKLALQPEQSQRLEEEAEVLRRFKDRQIVELKDKLQIGSRTALLLSLAGEQTLAEYLAQTGTIPLELLQRFGEDLLRLLEILEQEGASHRDIKPSNLGVGRVGKNDALHLTMFDFSLARTKATDIGAGTPGYLDPFLTLRKRWDLAAERYAAAVTLYEMATGILPKWGDGKSHPALVECSLQLEAERFEPALRGGFESFFRKALARDASQRYDNAEEMRRVWNSLFVQAPALPELSVEPEAVHWDRVKPESLLRELGLSDTALQALDRAGVSSAGQLGQLPRSRLRSLKGLGARTRREVFDIQKQLETVFRSEPAPPEGQAGLDDLVESLLEASKPEDMALRQAWLGLVGKLPPWPTLAQVSAHLKIPALKVCKGLPQIRTSWQAVAELTAVGSQVADLLVNWGGLAAAHELAGALLAQLGSLSNDPEQRMQRATAVVRALVEVEGLAEQPRFAMHRLETTTLIASHPDLVPYASQLGATADALAQREPLPSRGQVAQELRQVALPALDFQADLSETRLVRMAVETARLATLSSRGELYPRGMEARRALLLAHGALLGEPCLPVERIISRVSSRYPEAQSLPPRPELDQLLAELNLDLLWSEAQNAFVRRGSANWTTTGSSLRRRSTASQGPGEITPEVVAAQEFEDRLQGALERREALVLTVTTNDLPGAQAELAQRFPIEVRSLETELLRHLQRLSKELPVPWETIIKADAAGPGSPPWPRLQLVVSQAVAAMEAELKSLDRPLCLIHPGLLGRYQPRLETIERLLLASGMSGPPGVWVLVEAGGPTELPTVDHLAVPLPPARGPLFIPREWLRNLHRAGATS